MPPKWNPTNSRSWTQSSETALGQGTSQSLDNLAGSHLTGIDGTREEFPVFREFWLRKPNKEDTQASFFALLDSPSYSGAYSFKVEPGNDTIVNVKAVIFTRRAVQRLALLRRALGQALRILSVPNRAAAIRYTSA